MVKILSNHEQDNGKDKAEFKAHLESSSSTLLSIANASEPPSSLDTTPSWDPKQQTTKDVGQTPPAMLPTIAQCTNVKVAHAIER